jgi:hypothetical protein
MSEQQLQQYHEIIKAFVLEMINDTTHRLGNNFLVHLDGQQLAQINLAFQNPLQSPIGQQLDEIARAACGLMTDDEEGINRGTVYEGIQDLMEQLFAPPGLGAAYTIPSEFWQTDLGAMVSKAWLWVRQDRLITQSEAAKIAGVSVAAIGMAIRDGRLSSHHDPDVPNPRQGGTKVSEWEVKKAFGGDK